MGKVFNLLLIPLLVVMSHWTSILTYTLIRNIKAGQYVTPLFGWRFESWWPFITISVAALQVFYWTGGVMIFTAYKLSLDHFKKAYPAVILNLIAMTAWTILMMYFRVRELPTRDGWIALALTIIVSLLAINSGRNIKP